MLETSLLSSNLDYSQVVYDNTAGIMGISSDKFIIKVGRKIENLLTNANLAKFKK